MSVDTGQRRTTINAGAAAALEAQRALGRGDADASTSAQSAVRSGTTSTAQPGDIGRPRSTSVDPRTGLRKGASEGQTQAGHISQYPNERIDANPHTPPFP